VDEEDEENEEHWEEQEVVDETGIFQGPVPEKTILSKEAITIILAIGTVGKDCLLPAADSGIIFNTHAVIQALQDTSPENKLLPQLDSRASLVGNAVFLAALVKRCQRAEVLRCWKHRLI